MTDELESALRRTLAAAADRAPKAPPGIGLPPARRPRRYTRVALVAAAVTVAIGGVAVGGRTVLPRGSFNGPSSAGGSSRDLRASAAAALPPIEQVWPKAVHRVPRALPDGRALRPEALADGRTLLVTAGTHDLYAYDLRTHAVRRVTTIRTPGEATGFTTGGGYVAWWLAGGRRAEIWAAPLAGGPAHLVSRTEAPTRLAIAGGYVAWSVSRTGGVYRAPVSGGPARMIPGTRSLYLLQWPWAGSPPATRGDEAAFGRVRDVVTGETRSARLTGRASWACGPTWCVGRGPGFVTEAQRRDGSARHAVPVAGPATGVPPSLDRFVITVPARGTVAVYDLRTGRTGGITGNGPREPAGRLYYTATRDGYVIVDLGAI